MKLGECRSLMLYLLPGGSKGEAGACERDL